MTDEDRMRIVELRKEGKGYKRIAQLLGLSENTVKSFCRRRHLLKENPEDKKDVCPCCGKVLVQLPGRKPKKFCSDKCRMKWWNSHLDQVNRKANYSFVCPVCKKQFSVYGNANRKYCSHACYIKARFGGDGA